MSLDLERRQNSFPRLKYPPLREHSLRTPQQWLKSKRLQDSTDGLWRVHDSLYDLTDFIASHPGGPQWLILTKGTDVTEAFETHHLKNTAEKLLPKYFVKKAETSRNSPFTFNEGGFYKSLKIKVQEKLAKLPPDVRKRSDFVTDFLLLCLVITSPICCWLWTKNFILGVILTEVVGFLLCSISISAHNYYHRRDSWRMYLYNLSGMSYEDWRISHAISHHLHTNTLNDLEISALDPFLQYMPRRDKSVWAQLAALYYPVVIPFVLLGAWVKEFIAGVLNYEGKKFSVANIIPFLVPTWMWYTSIGGLSIMGTIAVWIAALMTSSFFFMIYGLTAGHHTHENFFDGDVPRNEYVDWGIHQLDTVVERVDYIDSHFKSLTRFGNHILHHLFPTVDHAELKYLYPILLDHCKEFNVEIRMTTFYKSLINHSKQLLRKDIKIFKDKENQK